MSNGLNFARGLGAAASIPSMTEEQRLAWYKKHNIDPPPVKPSPLKRAVKWVGDKLASTAGVSAAGAAPGQPPATPDVSLIERLKAGNIDEYGSEAYNRWGQGKTDGDAAELAREAARMSPGSAPAAPAAAATPPESPQAALPDAAIVAAADLSGNAEVTPQEWQAIASHAPANPRWDGLPSDEYATEIGAQA